MEDWARSILSSTEQNSIKQKIRHLEETTGAELVVVVARASDPYPAATLRLAIFVTAVASFFIAMFYQLPTQTAFILVQAPLFVLGMGLGSIPFFKKIFYSTKEIRREVHEKAQELFTNVGMADAADRSGSLLLISVHENLIDLIVDKKLHSRMSDRDLERISKMIKKEIERKKYFVGLMTAIEMLEEKYLHFFPEGVRSEGDKRHHESLIWIDHSQ